MPNIYKIIHLKYKFSEADDVRVGAAIQWTPQFVCSDESFVLTFQLVEMFSDVHHAVQRCHDGLVTRIILVMTVQYVLQHTNDENYRPRETNQQMK